MKPSKIIFVVCSPKPGQTQGDWLVRMHGKYLSRHRNKDTAIDRARIEARKRNYTVMIQNKNGTFSKGFHPVPK